MKKIYETISHEKARVLQESVEHAVRHGGEGDCPSCGQPGIYDLKVSNYENTQDIWSKNIEIKASQSISKKIAI